MTLCREWLTAYFDDVHRRRRYAKRRHRREVRFSDGSSPDPTRCHDNVRRFIAENPIAVRVAGWLILYDGRYLAHSMVRDRKKVFDITPSDYELRFILHVGSDDEFRKMEMPYADVIWPPLPSDMRPAGFA